MTAGIITATVLLILLAAGYRWSRPDSTTEAHPPSSFPWGPALVCVGIGLLVAWVAA